MFKNDVSRSVMMRDGETLSFSSSHCSIRNRIIETVSFLPFFSRWFCFLFQPCCTSISGMNNGFCRDSSDEKKRKVKGECEWRVKKLRNGAEAYRINEGITFLLLSMSEGGDRHLFTSICSLSLSLSLLMGKKRCDWESKRKREREN